MNTELRIQLSNSTPARATLQIMRMLFKLGMSWDICHKANELPSRQILNDFLATGRDDIEVRFGPEESGTIYWEPFELTQSEYEDFVDWALAVNPHFSVDFHPTESTYQAWFCSRV